jgi:hypothetical protein
MRRPGGASGRRGLPGSGALSQKADKALPCKTRPGRGSRSAAGPLHGVGEKRSKLGGTVSCHSARPAGLRSGHFGGWGEGILAHLSARVKVAVHGSRGTSVQGGSEPSPRWGRGLAVEWQEGWEPRPKRSRSLPGANSGTHSRPERRQDYVGASATRKSLLESGRGLSPHGPDKCPCRFPTRASAR